MGDLEEKKWIVWKYREIVPDAQLRQRLKLKEWEWRYCTGTGEYATEITKILNDKAE